MVWIKSGFQQLFSLLKLNYHPVALPEGTKIKAYPKKGSEAGDQSGAQVPGEAAEGTGFF